LCKPHRWTIIASVHIFQPLAGPGSWFTNLSRSDGET